MLARTTGYEALTGSFRWSIPEHFNIAVACCDRRAVSEPGRVALIRREVDGSLTPTTYGTLKRDSDRLAHALRARGVHRGDRVAILLPQSTETVVAHLAVYKLGAIALPLAALFGVIIASLVGHVDPTAIGRYEFPALTATVLGGTSLAGGVGRPADTAAAILVIAVITNVMTILDYQYPIQLLVQGVVLTAAVAYYAWQRGES